MSAKSTYRNKQEREEALAKEGWSGRGGFYKHVRTHHPFWTRRDHEVRLVKGQQLSVVVPEANDHEEEKKDETQDHRS